MTDVVGAGPVAYSNKSGQQRVVPLSAFVFDPDIQIRTDWAAALKDDEKLILPLLVGRVKAGELTPAPTPPPIPAIKFTAANAVPESNGIVVTIATGEAVGPGTELTITATQTDEYAGLVNADAAVKAIGVDAAKPGYTVGTGLVVVDSTATIDTTDHTPPDPFSDKDVSPEYTVTTGGATPLFTLKALVPPPSGAITASLVVNPDQTFTLTVVYTSKADPKVTVLNLDALDPSVGYLVTAAVPGGGAAVPGAGSTHLTGGGPGIAAAAVAYTS